MKRMLRLLTLFLAFGFLAACATPGPVQRVQNGDHVKVDYTCRLADGSLAATTLASVARNKSEKKSVIFKPAENDAPFSCTVGAAPEIQKARMGKGKIVGFEPTIQRELKKQLAGLPVGRPTAVQLVADANEDLSPHTRYYSQALTRRREKKRQISLSRHIEYFGSKPRVGQTFEYDNAFVATYMAVDEAEDTITIQIHPKPGAVYRIDLGKATITERENDYLIVFNVTEGRLVRTGNKVGRVVKVDDRRVLVDWGHPFGHETLSCDVTVYKD